MLMPHKGKYHKKNLRWGTHSISRHLSRQHVAGLLGLVTRLGCAVSSPPKSLEDRDTVWLTLVPPTAQGQAQESLHESKMASCPWGQILPREVDFMAHALFQNF